MQSPVHNALFAVEYEPSLALKVSFCVADGIFKAWLTAYKSNAGIEVTLGVVFPEDFDHLYSFVAVSFGKATEDGKLRVVRWTVGLVVKA